MFCCRAFPFRPTLHPETGAVIDLHKPERPAFFRCWIESPLDLVYGAVLVMLQRVGPTQHRYRKDHYGFGWYAEELDRQLSPLLLLYQGLGK